MQVTSNTTEEAILNLLSGRLVHESNSYLLEFSKTEVKSPSIIYLFSLVANNILLYF